MPAVFRRSPLHDGAMQTVSAAKQRAAADAVAGAGHAAASRGAWTWQTPCGSAPPASTGQQVPPRPGWLQLTHGALAGDVAADAVGAEPGRALAVLRAHGAVAAWGRSCRSRTRRRRRSRCSDVQVVAHLFVAGSQLNGAQIVAGPGLAAALAVADVDVADGGAVAGAGLADGAGGVLAAAARCRRRCRRGRRSDASRGRAGSDASRARRSRRRSRCRARSGTLQVLHVSVQALLQQTPSTQKPLWQSPAQPHAWPFALRGARVAVAAGRVARASGFGTAVVAAASAAASRGAERAARTSARIAGKGASPPRTLPPASV